MFIVIIQIQIKNWMRTVFMPDENLIRFIQVNIIRKEMILAQKIACIYLKVERHDHLLNLENSENSCMKTPSDSSFYLILLYFPKILS